MAYTDAEGEEFTIEPVYDLGVRIEGWCKLTKPNMFGKVVSKELPANEVVLAEWLVTPRGDRAPVQFTFPRMTATEREFLLTGMTDEEWAEFVGDEEDDLRQ
jgi:hypothetical protein